MQASNPTAADIAAALLRRSTHDRAVVRLTLRSPAVRPCAGAPLDRPACTRGRCLLFSRPLANQPDGQSVIAGYPWFGDWGRDTMISLPGLTLATGRPEIALRILRTFASFVSEGMLPNVFPGAGDRADYNTADASLWFFEAGAPMSRRPRMRRAARGVPGALGHDRWHRSAARATASRVDPADGLLKAGAPGVQLTWMDAKVGDWVVTPRIGKPVEINALWYNALRIMSAFAATPGRARPLRRRRRRLPSAALRASCAHDGEGLVRRHRWSEWR